MAHKQQQQFITLTKSLYPTYFKNVRVLDVGSLDINGSARQFFDDPYYYVGLDLGIGKNVDIVCPGHLYKDFPFDIVFSGECLEHDRYWKETLLNMYDLLKPGGMLLFTCASTGRAEHGTLRTTPENSPFTSDTNYYQNLTEEDIRSVFNPELEFSEFLFKYNPETYDLYFYGIKYVNTHK